MRGQYGYYSFWEGVEVLRVKERFATLRTFMFGKIACECNRTMSAVEKNKNIYQQNNAN